MAESAAEANAQTLGLHVERSITSDHCPVLVSDRAAEAATLMLIVPGSGALVPGFWSSAALVDKHGE